MTAALTIRRIAPEDAQPMRELIVDIQHEEFGFEITPEDQPDLSDDDLFGDDGYYSTGGGSFWVAVEDGAVIGSIALRDCGDGIGALRKVFVATGHRGPRPDGSTVAGALFDQLLSHACGAGFTEVLVGTTQRFTAAHRFYAKHGFEPIDVTELPATFPRMGADTRFYRRRLS